MSDKPAEVGTPDPSASPVIRPEDVKVLEPILATGIKNIEIVEKFAKMLASGRRYFGSSGASLTHQAYNPEWADKGISPALAKVGLEAERDTTLILKEWMKDKPNVVLVDSVHIRGWGKEEVLDEELGIIDGGDTDHVLIMGSEVILIDTKRWKSKRTYSIDSKGQVLRAKREFPGGKVKATSAAYLWFNYLNQRPAPSGNWREANPYELFVLGLVHINADDVTVIRDANWFRKTKGWHLVEKARFTELLDRRWNDASETNRTTIDPTLVAQVALNAVRPYDARQALFGASSDWVQFERQYKQ